MKKIINTILLMALITLSACNISNDIKSFKSLDITGAPYAANFPDGVIMTNQNNEKIKIQDYQGKIIAMFFGFAQCPDVCPTTLGEMRLIKEELDKTPKYANKLQVIFITLDPVRDTKQILKEYMQAFDDSFIALSAENEEQTRKLANQFKIIYQKVPSKNNPNNYTIDHSANTYIYDTKSNIRLSVKYGESKENILQDIKQILDEDNQK